RLSLVGRSRSISADGGSGPAGESAGRAGEISHSSQQHQLEKARYPTGQQAETGAGSISAARVDSSRQYEIQDALGPAGGGAIHVLGLVRAEGQKRLWCPQ